MMTRDGRLIKGVTCQRWGTKPKVGGNGKTEELVNIYKSTFSCAPSHICTMGGLWTIVGVNEKVPPEET